MSEPLTVSEQRALGRMGEKWIAAYVSGRPDGTWRIAPEYREMVAAVETASDRAARELGDLERRHARERADLEARHGGQS